MEEGAEAVEFMADIISKVGLLYPSKTLELAIFLHLDAIDQQLQIRQVRARCPEADNGTRNWPCWRLAHRQ